ncbi:ECF transporter S component [Streptococcus zalophi]|uniref:ECF transporter S component n=1 Tax=Streptococcus zalophi TaxID=640031 RepID=A0A934PA80_9STRE|nr:ECF transporter S component [Streptococcus zalophi]MBJ8349942.1 ECF transporter S component [Streptococcus zalophi]MCR8966937.1 ECF transporter S component [Streptococcus zalophi]
MKKTNLSQLTTLAIITSLSIIMGIYIQIKTPTGFLTLLDAGIFFTAFYFGSKEGAIVGGLSGFLIDLILGYPNWMFISLIAHGGQGFFAGWTGQKRVVGLILATLTMVLCYFLASIVMYGYGAALSGIYGNLLQNMVGMAVGFSVSQALKRLKK